MIYSYYGSKLKLNSNKINRSKRARETEARASFYLRFLGGFFELWPALATSRRAEDADWDEAQTREEEEDEEEEEEEEEDEAARVTGGAASRLADEEDARGRPGSVEET